MFCLLFISFNSDDHTLSDECIVYIWQLSQRFNFFSINNSLLQCKEHKCMYISTHSVNACFRLQIQALCGIAVNLK